MKKVIRNHIKAQLKAQDEWSNNKAALDVLIQLKPLLNRALNIAVYHAYATEISLVYVIEYCLSHGKRLYQPLTYKNQKHMLLVPYDVNKTGVFSPQEFVPKSDYEWYNLDLVLLPLVAVDGAGTRLGKGGGYYDTTLAMVANRPQRPLFCGVGFNLQFIEHIPHEDWDIKLDYFASEKQLIKF